MNPRGKEMRDILKNFIVIEGLAGSGTTTQLKAIEKALLSDGQKVKVTCEPTKRPIGQLVRRVLSGEFVTTSRSLALLYSADREDHLYNTEESITKWLEEGNIVISDRYFFSSLAYQGIDVGYKNVAKMNQYPLPEVLIYIDVSPSICMERIEKRGSDKEIFEKKSFLDQVACGYEQSINELDTRVKLIRIDGTQSMDDITHELLYKLGLNA